MYEASSDARNRIAAACSSVVPYRFIRLDEIVWSTTCRYHSPSWAFRSSALRGMRRGGASMPPGATPQTRMPCAAYSKARQAVMAFTPPLAAAYGTRLMPRVAIEETLTITPPPPSSMEGRTAGQHHSVG